MTRADAFAAIADATSEPGEACLRLAEAAITEGDSSGAREVLRVFADVEDGFRRWLHASRLLRHVADALPDHRPFRVALVGTATLDQLGPAIEVGGLSADLDLEVYTAGFGQYETSILDPSSELYQFRPEVIVLCPDVSGLAPPQNGDDDGSAAAAARWTRTWDAIRQHSEARILQCNLVPRPERVLGSLDASHAGGHRNHVARVNDHLAAEAGATVQLVDLASLAADLGLRRWHDDRYWFQAKQPFSLGVVPEVVREIIAVLGASLGRSKKVLVTDLDDTLWGGTVGEDGVETLRLGGDSVGEAHLAVQDHLLALKRRGVLLAVCSKNDRATAERPFIERDDMRLSLDDFATFVANWEPKADNLGMIAERLDLALDAFVFVDDNPAERAAVRHGHPEVDVIELPSDVSAYRRTLASYRGFEPNHVTSEDAARTDQYRARAAALELRDQSSSLGEYLASLHMEAHVTAFDPATLPRIAQLVAKTNQWNLTTRRHSLEALEKFAHDDRAVCLSLRLADRFADHGLIAVAIAIIKGDVAELDTLLMSCRVIGRGVERVLLANVAARAAQLGATTIVGRYEPTERNGVVRDLFPSLGFQSTGDEALTWCLETATVASLVPESILVKDDA